MTSRLPVFEWDDIPEAEYVAKVNEARTRLALLPDYDTVRTFVEVGENVKSMCSALETATRDQSGNSE